MELAPHPPPPAGSTPPHTLDLTIRQCRWDCGLDNLGSRLSAVSPVIETHVAVCDYVPDRAIK